MQMFYQIYRIDIPICAVTICYFWSRGDPIDQDKRILSTLKKKIFCGKFGLFREIWSYLGRYLYQNKKIRLVRSSIVYEI